MFHDAIHLLFSYVVVVLIREQFATEHKQQTSTTLLSLLLNKTCKQPNSSLVSTLNALVHAKASVTKLAHYFNWALRAMHKIL